MSESHQPTKRIRGASLIRGVQAALRRVLSACFVGAPGGIRTPDHLVRSQRSDSRADPANSHANRLTQHPSRQLPSGANSQRHRAVGERIRGALSEQFSPQVWEDRTKPPPDPNAHTMITIAAWGVLAISTLNLGQAAAGVVGVRTGWWVVETGSKATDGLTPEIQENLRTSVDDAIRQIH